MHEVSKPSQHATPAILLRLLSSHQSPLISPTVFLDLRTQPLGLQTISQYSTPRFIMQKSFRSLLAILLEISLQ
jgi:hypothetical protein